MTSPQPRFSFLRRSSAFILAVYVLLTLLLTHPLLFNVDSAVPNDIGDPLLNTWILAWDSQALLTDPLSLFQANIFYPLPNTLAYSEHLFSTALLALPLQLICAEPIVAYNLSWLATFPLAAFGMYLLVLHWTRQRSAAFMAGLMFAFAPYRFAAIAHLQLLTFQWLPFILLSLDKTLAGRRLDSDRPEAKAQGPLLLIIFLILQLLASWYLALYTLVIVGVYLLTHLLARLFNKPAPGTPSWLRLILIFFISCLLVLPLAWPYLSLLDELRAARPLSLALSLAAAPTDFVAAAPFNHFFGSLTASFRARPGFTEENTLFVGYITPLLALIPVIAIILRLAGRPGGASSGWLGISQLLPTIRQSETSRRDAPCLTFHTSPFIPHALFLILLLSLALTFPAPYAALINLFPPSSIVRVPPRWIIPALFALSGLAALGYAIVTQHVAALGKLRVGRFTFHVSHPVFWVLGGLLLLETCSAPLPLARVENRVSLNPAYHWLAALPGELALIELPLHSAPAPEYPEVKRLYASTLGWWKLVNGYSGYTPPRQPQLAQSLADFPGPKSIAALQNLASSISFRSEGESEASSANAPIPQPSNSQTFQPFNLSTFQPPLFLLVHPGETPFERSQWESIDRWQAERQPALRPIAQFEGDYLYQVLPLDLTRLTTSPLAAFGPDKNIQLLAYDLSSPNFRPSLEAFVLLYWRSTTSLAAGYTVFIHLRAADGFVRSQADGPPVSGHYPTPTWQPGEIIQDIHPWPGIDMSQVDHLAVGLYDPATGKRLPAFGPNGQRLSEDALIVPLDQFK